MLHYIIQHSPLLYFTQSFWRDEAFSVLVSKMPLADIWSKLSFEPPLYYILLHFWMKIFGDSEIATRSLSLTGVVLAAIIVIIWAEKLFPRSKIQFVLPVLFVTNPMIVYYAFEVRTYGWYIFFTVLSLYAYWRRNWKMFAVAAIGGFYTHAYFLIHFGTIMLYHIFFVVKKPKRILTDPCIRSAFFAALIMTPWIWKILTLSTKLTSSWYFPVDIQLIKSVLGNMYIGYEGTPWYLWKYTRYLSFILLILFMTALKNKSKRHFTILLLMTVFLPLTFIISVSFMKPLFVNRYFIPVTISEVFLTVFALETIRVKNIKLIAVSAVLALHVFFLTWYPSKHAKLPYRTTMQEVNTLAAPTDLIYTTSSLNYLETLYYSSRPENVRLYNTTGYAFPWYVGDAIFSPDRMAYSLPLYPKRAIIVSPQGDISIQYNLTDN